MRLHRTMLVDEKDIEHWIRGTSSAPLLDVPKWRVLVWENICVRVVPVPDETRPSICVVWQDRAWQGVEQRSNYSIGIIESK